MTHASVIAVAVLSIAMAAAQGSRQPAGQGRGSGEAAIKEVADAYVKAVLAGDAKAVAAVYTEDAVEMPPNAPSIKGRAAIEQHYTKLMAGGKVGSFTLAHVESRAAGDTGYEVGTYQQTMTPLGASTPVTDTGKYVVILKRAAGAWKVAYVIYNSDQAPPAK